MITRSSGQGDILEYCPCHNQKRHSGPWFLGGLGIRCVLPHDKSKGGVGNVSVLEFKRPAQVRLHCFGFWVWLMSEALIKNGNRPFSEKKVRVFPTLLWTGTWGRPQLATGMHRKGRSAQEDWTVRGGNSYLMFKKLVLSARANKKLLIIIL